MILLQDLRSKKLNKTYARDGKNPVAASRFLGISGDFARNPVFCISPVKAVRISDILHQCQKPGPEVITALKPIFTVRKPVSWRL
jgi:hypothetical protein